jgi:hypothetical protein
VQARTRLAGGLFLPISKECTEGTASLGITKESSRDAEMTDDFRNRFTETQRSQWVCFMLNEPTKKKQFPH